MWCPNPTNVNSLGSGFGLQIYLLVGFLTILQKIQLQTQPKQPNYKYPCDFQPQNPLILKLSPSPSLVYFPHFFVLLLLCILSFFPLTSYSFLLFSSNSLTNLHYLPSLPLYNNLFVVGFKSLLFCQVPCNPTFTQNPKES